MSTREERVPADRVAAGNILVGTAGWSYPDWEGTVYPPGTADKLAFLSDHLPLVEVNSSFYRIPAARTTESWARRVEHQRDFRFTIKLWRGFTHDRDEPAGREAAAFTSALEPLRQAGRLGALLLQFPWSFRDTPQNRERIRRLSGVFSPYHPVLELRHGSWGRGGVESLLEGLGVGYCSIDQPTISDGLPPLELATGSLGYVRLHGRNSANWFREDAGRDARYDYLYSEQELAPWCERIRRIASRARRTFVVTNNHFQGQALANALEIMHRLTGRKVLMPDPLPLRFPRLSAIRHLPPGTQPTLFS